MLNEVIQSLLNIKLHIGLLDLAKSMQATKSLSEGKLYYLNFKLKLLKL